MRFAALPVLLVLAICSGCSPATPSGPKVVIAPDSGDCPATVAPADIVAKPLPSDIPHAGKPVKMMHPLYPPCAEGRGINGVADFALTIGPDGSVGDVQLIQEVPAGFGFGKSGLDVLPQWVFQPKLIDGKPTAVRTVYRISWKLDETLPDQAQASQEKIVVTGYRIVRWDQIADCPPVPDPKTLMVQPPPAEISETGTVLMRVPPEFPVCAEHRRVSGVVDLVFTVKPDGFVSDVQVAQEVPVGFGFAAAAVKAVSHWQYQPKLVDGKAVAFRTRVRFNQRTIGPLR